MNIGERIKQRRKQLGISAEELAERIGKSPATIYRYENGEISKVDSSMLRPISDALQTTPAHLMGWDEPSFPTGLIPRSRLSTRRVPILGDTAAGEPIVANRVYDEFIDIPDDGHRYDAALRVTGDSMSPRYRIGDLALIRYQDDVEDGQVAAVCLDDCVTLKRVYHMPRGIQLLSDNPAHPPQIYMDDEIGSAHLVGLAVGVLHWEY